LGLKVGVGVSVGAGVGVKGTGWKGVRVGVATRENPAEEEQATEVTESTERRKKE
jgi:hypothetical protein